MVDQDAARDNWINYQFVAWRTVRRQSGFFDVD